MGLPKNGLADVCGIAGTVRLDDDDQIERRLASALDLMTHRGPDDRGYELVQWEDMRLLLGQTRLSIIDLSSRGHQPMVTGDERFIIVFNGEIYNYVELRAELRSQGVEFSTQTDTEVLLAAWVRWGSVCLARLKGMFAFSVFDRRERSLTCVRDAFGIKPLFYAERDGGFDFASELPALLALGGKRRSVNHLEAYRYLEYGLYDDSEDTLVEGVHRIPPAGLLVYDLVAKRVASQEVWWRPQVQERSQLTFSGAASELRERLSDNVRMHLRSDVPLGAALSGGVDSSAVVGLMRQCMPDSDIHTFSYLARGTTHNEESWVDIVNRSTSAIAHKVLPAASSLTRDIDDVIRSQGEPFGSTSIYAQYRVFQAVREAGIIVTLDGQGADELLAGYSGYPVPRIRSLISQHQYLGALMFFKDWGQWPDRSRRILLRGLAAEIAGPRARGVAKGLLGRQPQWFTGSLPEMQERYESENEELVGRYLASALRRSLTGHGLQALLRHGDRNSMAFSVESRVPFLTVDLAEFLLGLPEAYLVSARGETKSVLRAAMRGIVPDAILDRRDKVGFATPEEAWLSAHAPKVVNWLDGAEAYEFMNVDNARKKVQRYFESPGSVGHAAVWRAVNFSRWLQVMDVYLE